MDVRGRQTGGDERMPEKLQTLAEWVGGRVIGDGSVIIRHVRPITEAGEGDITFLSNPRYRRLVERTNASAVIVPPEFSHLKRNLLVCENPYLAFARVLELLYPPPPHLRYRGVEAGALVHPTAVLGNGVSIWSGACVGERTHIGDHTILMPGVFVGEDCRIGSNCVLHPNVVLYHGTVLGNRVTIHANSVVGSEGFGFAPDGVRYHKIPQVGITVIEDDVSIGANTTINRAAMGRTLIRRGCKIDSQVIISHNVDLGEDSLVVSHVGIAGTTKIGRHVTIAGMVAVVGHITIGDNVTVAAGSLVTRDLAPGRTYFGTPARPIAETRRILAAMRDLPTLRRRVAHLEARLAALEKRAVPHGQRTTDLGSQRGGNRD